MHIDVSRGAALLIAVVLIAGLLLLITTGTLHLEWGMPKGQ